MVASELGTAQPQLFSNDLLQNNNRNNNSPEESVLQVCKLEHILNSQNQSLEKTFMVTFGQTTWAPLEVVNIFLSQLKDQKGLSSNILFLSFQFVKTTT